MKHKVTVETVVDKDVEEVWKFWTSPEHITNWNFATPEWHCPTAEHELEVGGKLKYHMAAKDGSMAFDYIATFEKIKPNELLEYVLDDERKVTVNFNRQNGSTKIIEVFEVEDEYSMDMQRQGWQAILDNFKSYAESK